MSGVTQWPAHRRRPQHELRLRRAGHPVLAIAAMAVAAVLATSGVSWALWSDSFTNPSLQVATGAKVGISLARVGGTATAATGPTSILTVGLTVADGQQLVAAAGKSIAIPIVVRMRADGNAGIAYSFALPTMTAGTLFAASTMRLFPVTATTDAAAQAACTVAAAPTTQPSTTNITGITTGIDPAAPLGVATAYWCLTAVYSGTGGTYSNTGTATGTAPSGATVTGQGSWQAFLISPAVYSLSHQISLPVSP